MKRGVRGSSKKKVFKSINVILIALLFVELVFLVDSGITGNPIKSAIKKVAMEKAIVGKVNVAKTASCIPSKEICDKKDNDCDKLVDEGGVCKTTQVASSTSSSLGQLVTKEGTVELMIVDNFEKPELSKEVYYLNENGKRYLLSTDQPLPVSAKIKVTGYLKDNTLSFSNSPTKASALQGTSYITTSPMIEPWPKTLGEQRYAVVFLFMENETQFDVNNFTNITFGLANQWIQETSYGKASVSYGYVGNFSFNESLCYSYEIMNEAINKVDPFVNFNDYDGIIIYHPNTNCVNYIGAANVGKVSLSTGEGEIKLYRLWMNRGRSEEGYPSLTFGPLVHEMGHNFGLLHSGTFHCGEFPNRETLLPLCYYPNMYGNLYDVMGNALYIGPYSLRNRIIMGWVDESDVIEASEGVFFVSSINDGETDTILGIKIPIVWDADSDVIISSWGEINPFSYYFGELTHYYLEYRTTIHNYLGYLGNMGGYDFYDGTNDNEMTYGLNISEINKAIFIHLGRDNMHHYDLGEPIGHYFTHTSVIGVHPNANSSGLGFESDAILYSMLLKNETYSDPFNKMNITVLDMNESGALIKITKWPTCTDTDDGSSIYVKGTVNATNSSGTYSYTDYCINSNYVREYYCQNNQALSTNAYCSKGCSNYNGACTRPTSTGCYIDPKTKKKICPSQLT